MIKYHDNNGTKAHEYDENGHLANNWDADKDYGNEYANVHFRIECPKFSGYTGSFTYEEDREDFTIEKIEVFKSIGWNIKSTQYCMEVYKDNSSLYLHPQDFSGVVKKNEIKGIAEALEKHKTFYLRWVDVYQTVYVMTDEEYDAYLETRREDARRLVFQRCRTTRTYNYKHMFDICDYVGAKIMLPRVGCKSVYNCSGKDASFVGKIIEELEAEGYLKYAETPNGIQVVRALNRSELKAKKLKALA